MRTKYKAIQVFSHPIRGEEAHEFHLDNLDILDKFVEDSLSVIRKDEPEADRVGVPLVLEYLNENHEGHSEYYKVLR